MNARHEEPGIIIGLIVLLVGAWGACQACTPERKPEPEERNRWTVPSPPVVVAEPADADAHMLDIPLYLLEAMKSWTPISDHHFTGEKAEDTEARYLGLARVAATAAKHEPPLPNLTHEQSALLLVSVGSYESGGWRRDVQECRASGDHGRSWTVWGLWGPKNPVCGDPDLAAKTALDRLRRSMTDCGSLAVQERLAAYASGHCNLGLRESRNRWNRAMDWIKRHPL